MEQTMLEKHPPKVLPATVSVKLSGPEIAFLDRLASVLPGDKDGNPATRTEAARLIIRKAERWNDAQDAANTAWKAATGCADPTAARELIRKIGVDNAEHHGKAVLLRYWFDTAQHMLGALSLAMVLTGGVGLVYASGTLHGVAVFETVVGALTLMVWDNIRRGAR